MIITYFRSSSYNTWDFCPQQYYMEYVLGLPQLSGKKADKGTIVHKIMEDIAVKKTKNIVLTEKQIGNLIRRTYKKFTTNEKMSHHKWADIDQRDCTNWVWKALKTFDPRHVDIVAAEPHFDFTIKKPWAKYAYRLNGNGATMNGHLSIKGTIDLVTKIDDDTYEVVDYKTGRRLNWATGEVKTLAKLQDDPQLLLYYYAVKHMYPEAQYVIVSIFYINDGGMYTVCFEDKDVTRMENMLRKRFEIIKNTTVPPLNRSWKCDKLCHYGKNTFKDIMLDDGSVFPCTMCEQIKSEVLKIGIDKTTLRYVHYDHNINKYNEPGQLK